MTKHNYNIKLDIPQDADSARYFIPEGYAARIEDGVLIIEQTESEDERITSALLRGFNKMLENQLIETFYGEPIKDIIAYLEKQKEQKPADLPPGFYFIDQDGKRYYSKEFRYGDMKMKMR